jgi:hypothetical protein
VCRLKGTECDARVEGLPGETAGNATITQTLLMGRSLLVSATKLLANSAFKQGPS